MSSGPVEQKVGKPKPMAFMNQGPVKAEPKKEKEVKEELPKEELYEEVKEEHFCEECGKEAKSLAGLKAHMRSHN